MQFSTAEAPNSWPRQVTSTDLPAPLSPVTTFSPGVSSTASSAISAKSLRTQQCPCHTANLCLEWSAVEGLKL